MGSDPIIDPCTIISMSVPNEGSGRDRPRLIPQPSAPPLRPDRLTHGLGSTKAGLAGQFAEFALDSAVDDFVTELFA